MNDLTKMSLKVFANAEDISPYGVVTSDEILTSLKMFMSDEIAIKVNKNITKLVRFSTDGQTTPRDILTALRMVF